MSTVAVPPPSSIANASPLGVLGRRLAIPLLLSTACGFLFFYGLTTGNLYRTESLRAIIAQGFLDSGDWIVPRLYGEPLLTKPPGMYAAIALVSAPLGGVTTWSARLPSALAATATVLLFYGLFRRALGRLGGVVAACVVPTSVMWLDKATTAEIDMVQVFWVTGSLVFLFRALESEGRRAAWWWMAALLFVAGGTLTKWTAPAFFYLTALPLLWRRGEIRRLWQRPHLQAVGVAAVLVLVWMVLAVRSVGWEVFFNTVSQEACQRLVPNEVPLSPPRHHHRPYPWWETVGHPFVVFAACLPWSAFALVALWPGFAPLWSGRGREVLELLQCWLWPNLLFWSLVPEHAPRHSFPFFPAIAGLAALVWVAWLTGRLRWPLANVRPGLVFAGLVIGWLLLKAVFVQVVVPHRLQGREPLARGEEVASLVPTGEPLYLFRLKDEGILFYYCRSCAPGAASRTVRRLPGPAALPTTGQPHYGLVTESELSDLLMSNAMEVLARLRDQQGDPIALVRWNAAD